MAGAAAPMITVSKQALSFDLIVAKPQMLRPQHHGQSCNDQIAEALFVILSGGVSAAAFHFPGRCIPVRIRMKAHAHAYETGCFRMILAHRYMIQGCCHTILISSYTGNPRENERRGDRDGS